MKKICYLVVWVAMAVCFSACNKTPAQQAEQRQTADATDDSNTPKQTEEAELPPVLAVCVKGLPLFAPFNEGDIINGGRDLKQTPEKYTKLILDDTVYDVTYQGEKNKELKNDESAINEYYYKNNDAMKGQLYDYADPKAIENHLKTHGDMTAEGEIIPQEYADGILVPADYLKGRTVMKVMATTTEAPGEPQFNTDIVAKVEKMLGQKVEQNRIAYVFGKDECLFGVMRTKPNDKYGVAAWVLAEGKDVSIWTDTCEVVKEENRIYWSSIDPDEYMEPIVKAVVKGDKGYEIFTIHMNTDEMAHYFLMRQKGDKMTQTSMGSFYQRYE
ncbi:MAG: hypothetical protein IKX36_11765 [Prevotella sp.]|nr:hypothetical protein [Prevotella sp.]